MTETDEENAYGLGRRIGLFAGPAIVIAMVLAGPPSGLETPAWHAAAVGLLMAIWWITEALPIPATALLPLALFPLLGVGDFRPTASSYAHPLIFLFMGGFVIALAMERWNLHRRIALTLLSAVGTGPRAVIGGFMLATALLSMWVSNTATTLMMLPIGLSVVDLARDRNGALDREGRQFAVALVVAIAYAATIGGLATLIGTPPNALLAGFMSKTYGVTIGFAQWMLIGVPLAVVMLPVTWWLLTRVVFRFVLPEISGGRAAITGQIEALGPMGRGEKLVATVFVVTALLWVFRPAIGDLLPGLALTDYGIAITMGLVLFLLPVDFRRGIFAMDWETAARLPWGVLLLFGGGLALAGAIADTGLATWIADGIGGMGQLDSILLVLAVAAVIILLTELTSNTATTAAFLPIVGALAIGLGENPLLFVIPATLAASCAFMMPVATPPNAIIFGSGHVTIPQMARAGVLLNLLGLALVMAVTYTLVVLVFGIEPGVLPAWATTAES